MRKLQQPHKGGASVIKHHYSTHRLQSALQNGVGCGGGLGLLLVLRQAHLEERALRAVHVVALLAQALLRGRGLVPVQPDLHLGGLAFKARGTSSTNNFPN